MALIFCLGLGNINAQHITVFQPGPGANDGTDEGTATAGKDTWVNRYSPTDNYGNLDYAMGTPRTTCNPSDYKAYFKFDVSDLPDHVNSVKFGVTHIEHTAYCYSNCSADFYFYYCTSDWDENTLVQANLPTESEDAFYGPIQIEFPNDFGVMEYDITDAYNFWKNNPDQNFGFVIYSPDAGCNNASVYFGVKTSDDATEANRPYLKIDTPNQTGIDPNELDTNIAPNPFNDFINIGMDNISSCALYDIKGQQVNVTYDASKKQISTAHLPKGVYFLKLETNGNVGVKKLIKK